MLLKKLGKIGLATVALIAIFALIAVFRVFIPFRQAKQNLISIVAPKQYATVDKQHQARLRLLHPGLVGFKSKHNRNYLLVDYPKDDRWVIAAVFISGEVKPGRTIDKIVYEDEAGESQIVSFAQLKSKLKPGGQVGIE